MTSRVHKGRQERTRRLLEDEIVPQENGQICCKGKDTSIGEEEEKMGKSRRTKTPQLDDRRDLGWDIAFCNKVHNR